MIRRSALCLALLASLAAYFLAASAVAQTPDLRSQVEMFAALEDRSLGTPGCAQAADYLEQAFRNIFGGLEGAVIARQQFHTPVQRHRGSFITRLDTGASASLFPLRLNALATGAIGLPGYEGELIYAGRGELGDFNGLDPSGRIVLMDMDSGKNWQNAAMLGARALIFLDSKKLPDGGEDQAPRRRFEDKHELTPLDFPRFWMPESQAREFFQAPGPFAARRTLGAARLTSAMAWENTAGENVYCFVPGTDPGLANELVIVQAFYDSTAYAPGLSPGADEALSAATLLEVAAVLADSPPKRPVLLAATAGQAQGLAGMREFVGAFAAEEDLLADWREDMAERIGEAEEALEFLRTPAPLAALGNSEQAEILGRAFSDLLKDQVDAISRELMRLRLEQGGEQERIIALAEERMRYMRLQWAAGGCNGGAD